MPIPAGTTGVVEDAATTPPGGSWYTLLDIVREAAEDARQQRRQPPVACPHDGEPLTTGPDGSLACRYDGYRWPRDRDNDTGWT